MDDRRKPPVMSRTSTHGSFEGSRRAPWRPRLLEVMFRSRRQLAAAAGFWVVLAAAVAGISSIPGASAVTTPVFSDGFESGNLAQWTKSTHMSVQHQPVYAGSWAARATSTGSPAYAYKNLSTTLSELYYDGRFQAISQGAQNVSIVRFRTASDAYLVSIYRLGNGKLSYYNPVTGITTTGPFVSTGSWHDLDVHVLIKGTSSLVEVWLDGTKVISKTAESLGTTPVGRIYIGDNSTGHTFDYAFDNEVVSSGADSTAPSTPTGLTVSSATLGSITLAWAPSTDNLGVTGYDVFRNNTKLGTTSANAYTFSGLACGTSYTLGVDAFDAAANTSGRASVTAATKPCSGQPPDVTPPSTPTGLAVRGATQSSISLGWNASTDDVGVAGYHIFRNDSALGTTTATGYTFSGLACGTTYTLGVDAFDAAGNASGRASIKGTSSACSGGGGGGGAYIKTLDSTNAEPVGLSSDSNNCTLSRSELGDTMSMQSSSTRCTWTNQQFSQMGRHEVFDVSERFDQHAYDSSWENNILIRPSGSFGNANCSSGGNSQVMLVTVRVVSQSDGLDHWRLELRGGPSLQPADQDQYFSWVDLGPVVNGQTVTFKFDIVSAYQNGYAVVWKDGAQVYPGSSVVGYNSANRPLGFHYDCDRTTDISDFALRMQHGVYRGGSGVDTLTSSGFRFITSEP